MDINPNIAHSILISTCAGYVVNRLVPFPEIKKKEFALTCVILGVGYQRKRGVLGTLGVCCGYQWTNEDKWVVNIGDICIMYVDAGHLGILSVRIRDIIMRRALCLFPQIKRIRHSVLSAFLYAN